MSYLTIGAGILGLIAAFVFFYVLKFKASTKQTQRTDRIRWSNFIPYRNETFDRDLKKESEDATFKDDWYLLNYFMVSPKSIFHWYWEGSLRVLALLGPVIEYSACPGIIFLVTPGPIVLWLVRRSFSWSCFWDIWNAVHWECNSSSRSYFERSSAPTISL